MKALNGQKCGWRSYMAAIHSMSLVETLVTLFIGVSLVAVASFSAQSSMRKVKAIQCLSKMHNLGVGILLYVEENDEFPRSLHSAAGAGQSPWNKAILPYLGFKSDPSAQEWKAIFEKVYHCPENKSGSVDISSYALNVYFELTPDGDDYPGSPATWRKPVNVERKASTILLAEPKAVYFADHIMCHQWTSTKGASNAVDALRHGTRSNYLFVDGHVESLPVESTFNIAKGINLWNPSLAGR